MNNEMDEKEPLTSDFVPAEEHLQPEQELSPQRNISSQNRKKTKRMRAKMCRLNQVILLTCLNLFDYQC